MNKVIVKAKKNIINQKQKYLFLTVITLIGVISGILFIFFISKEDKLLVNEEIKLFFSNIDKNNLDFTASLLNSILSNILNFLIIWILGISIIGIPIIIFYLFLKGFVFGFSISSIIAKIGIKGILPSFFYQFPHGIIMLTLFILISFYAINFSVRLFRMLFLKENINLGPYFKRYNQVMGICILISLIVSLYEVFLVPILISLFL